jgi:hypothetical protein
MTVAIALTVIVSSQADWYYRPPGPWVPPPRVCQAIYEQAQHDLLLCQEIIAATWPNEPDAILSAHEQARNARALWWELWWISWPRATSGQRLEHIQAAIDLIGADAFHACRFPLPPSLR